MKWRNARVGGAAGIAPTHTWPVLAACMWPRTNPPQPKMALSPAPRCLTILSNFFPRTPQGHLRVTVQGEIIEQQFGEKEVCFRTLDLYTRWAAGVCVKERVC